MKTDEIIELTDVVETPKDWKTPGLVALLRGDEDARDVAHTLLGIVVGALLVIAGLFFTGGL